jgi:hypothetical protein
VDAATKVIHSYTHILIYPYTHILIYSYTHILIYSYTHTLIHSYTPTLIHSYTQANAVSTWKEVNLACLRAEVCITIIFTIILSNYTNDANT